MPALTMDLTNTAQTLGTSREAFLQFVEQEQLAGVVQLGGDWRVSIFTLASLLNTTPDALIELMEDQALGELLDEVDEDEWLEGEQARQFYARELTHVAG